MKKGKRLILAFAVGVFSSCSTSDDSSNGNFPADGVIRVTTAVADVPAVRGGKDANNLSAFNLNVETPGNSTYSYYAYMKKSGSVWDSYSSDTPTNSLVMLWKDSKTAINVTALGTSENTLKGTFNAVSGYGVATDQSSAEAMAANDILYLPTTSFDPSVPGTLSAEGKLNLTLKHFLSKFKIEMTFAPELNTPVALKKEDIKELTINGTKLKFSWKALDNSGFTLTSDAAANVKPLYADFKAASGNVKATSTYECVLVPQTVKKGDLIVSFKIGDFDYTRPSEDDMTLQSGYEHTLKLEVTPDGVNITGFSASEWTDGEGGNIESK